MFQRHLISRTFQIGACGAAIFLCATTGGAEAEKASKADKKACKVAYKSAQEREQAGHLREARDLLVSCSKTACGGLKKECTAKATALSEDLPSIVPLVTDDAGGVQVDVQVKMDGELLTSKLDGRAIFIDPGMHEFSFVADGGSVTTQKVMIAQGQRNRTIAVALHDKRGGSKRTLAASVTPAATGTNPEREEPAAEKPARKADSEPSSTTEAAPEVASTETASTQRRSGGGPGALPYIIGGTGLLAVGAGATLMVWGRKDNNLLGQCAPNCQQSSVDHVKTLYTAANISIGVGVVALGVATYLFASSGSKEKAPAKTAYTFDVAPTPTGAFASVSGAF